MNEIGLNQQVLFIKDVERLIGRHRMTLRRWWAKGKFPKPVKLNDSTLSWHRDVIDQWVRHHLQQNMSANF